MLAKIIKEVAFIVFCITIAIFVIVLIMAAVNNTSDFADALKICLIVSAASIGIMLWAQMADNIGEIRKLLETQTKLLVAKTQAPNIKPHYSPGDQAPASQSQPQAIQPQQEASAAQPEPTPSYVCPNCGKQNKITDRFCDACGLPNPNTQK